MLDGLILSLLARWSGELSARGMMIGMVVGPVLGALAVYVWHMVAAVQRDLLVDIIMAAIGGLFLGAVVGAYVGKRWLPRRPRG